MSNSPAAAPLQGPVAMSLPFLPESARTVRTGLTSWLVHQGAATETITDARLVATELVANALRHASPLPNGTMLVRWQEQSGRLLLSVSDGGGTTDPAVRHAADDDEGGRGLAIVAQLSGRWWVERQPWMQAVHVDFALAPERRTTSNEGTS
jgi:serine/threonine-protein kinase RsbW